MPIHVPPPKRAPTEATEKKPATSEGGSPLKRDLRTQSYREQSAAVAPAEAARAPQGVAGLQTQLARLGYDCGGADGVWGPKTRAAVVAFQRDRGLDADGVVGPLTSAALAAADGAHGGTGGANGAGPSQGAAAESSAQAAPGGRTAGVHGAGASVPGNAGSARAATSLPTDGLGQELMNELEARDRDCVMAIASAGESAAYCNYLNKSGQAITSSASGAYSLAFAALNDGKGGLARARGLKGKDLGAVLTTYEAARVAYDAALRRLGDAVYQFVRGDSLQKGGSGATRAPGLDGPPPDAEASPVEDAGVTHVPML